MKTLPTDEIAAALLTRFDNIKADIVRRIVADYNATAKRLSVTREIRVWNGETREMDSVTVSGWGFDYCDHSRRWNRKDGESCRYANKMWEPTSVNTVYSNEIDMEAVDAAAHKEAEAVCLAWHKKLVGKLGAVESATLDCAGVGSYVLTVRKAGIAESVRIEQQIVWKTAARSGQWFPQFPARIYVNGKFVPEAKFKAALALVALGAR